MKKPTIFGKYLLLERINVGGMAEVFIAKAFGVEGFERLVAIKRILPTMAEDEEFIEMFIDEARISVQLNHGNIVHIFELGRHLDSYFIAMEYVAGRDVRAILERSRRRKEPVPLPAAVFIASKMCEGLDYAHRKKDARGQELNIIHRDVSPQNILVSYDGEVKIIDFGIAKASNRNQKTQAGILKGKFGYMSPEQVRGLPIDRRSDIFAAGVNLYELLTGEKLFVGESDFSTLEKVRQAEVPPPSKFNPDIPKGLEEILLKALAREPEERYQWASELHDDLLKFLLQGNTLYTAKHLSAFMKESFAEDVAQEAERMAQYAHVERPEELEAANPQDFMPRRSTRQSIPPVQARTGSKPAMPAAAAPPPGMGSADKTQIFDSRIAAETASLLDAPTDGGDGRAAGAAKGPRVSSGGRAPVVVGSAQAYSGETMIGEVPQRPSKPAPAPGATRIRPAGSLDEEDEQRDRPTGSIVLADEPKTAGSDNPFALDETTRHPAGALRPGRSAAGSSRQLMFVGAGAVLFLGALALLGFWMLRKPMVDLLVYVSPDNAQITIDGRHLENRGDIQLPPGTYRIEASAPGYRKQFKDQLLAVESSPVAVTMSLDKELPSSAEPSASAPGGKVPAGLAANDTRPDTSRTPTSVMPGAALFTARFDPSPAGAEVYVNGHRLASLELADLRVGQTYAYEARLRGYKTKRGQFSSGGNSPELVVPVALEPESAGGAESPAHHRSSRRKGSLACSSNPAGAEIYVDSRPTHRITPVGVGNALALPVGSHTVIFKLNGHRSAPQHIVIRENELQKLINVSIP